MTLQRDPAWDRADDLLNALSLHEMDRARILLECGVNPLRLGRMTTAQAERLGTRLEVDPEYLLGQASRPVLHPRLYHNAPQELWRAVSQAVEADRLNGVLLLKCHRIDLDRLRPGMSNEDPRSMLAVVLTLRSPAGSYQVEGWQLWQPEPWTYLKSRKHVLSVLLLLRALDGLRHTGCDPRGIEIPVEEMKDLNDGTRHVSAVLGHARWLPKWDVESFLDAPGRRRDILASLHDYGGWQDWVVEARKPGEGPR